MDIKDIIQKYQLKEGPNHEFEIHNTDKLIQSKRELMTLPHRAKFYQILWNEKGKGNHIIDFNSVSIEDNTIIFIHNSTVSIFDKNSSNLG